MVIQRDRAFFRHKRDFLAGDFAFNGRLLAKSGHNPLNHMGVETPPGHIFTARAVTALDDQNIESGFCHDVRRHRARYASTDDDGIKFFIRHA